MCKFYIFIYIKKKERKIDNRRKGIKNLKKITGNKTNTGGKKYFFPNEVSGNNNETNNIKLSCNWGSSSGF